MDAGAAEKEWRAAGSGRGGGKFVSPVMMLAVWCFVGISLFASMPRNTSLAGNREGYAGLKQWEIDASSPWQILDSGEQPDPPGSKKETGDNAFTLLSNGFQHRLSAEALPPMRRRDRTLNGKECRAEFPALYPQLDELVHWWKRKGGLKKATIDRLEKEADPHWGHVRLIIHEGKIFIRSFKEGDETRNSALVHLLEEAINSWPSSVEKRPFALWHGGTASLGEYELPNIDLILSPGDRDCFPSEGGWMVTKNVHDHKHKGTWLIPDFGFTGWPEAGAASYGEFLELAADVEERFPWAKKFSRLFWRGFANVYAIRQDLMDRTSIKKDATRERWADVHETTFHNDQGDFVPIVTPHDHCQHKFLIHTEGNSYSGRSKYIFSCHSVVVAHPLQWTQHFHPALNNISTSPDQNFVQLPGPLFDGIEEAAKELQFADAQGGVHAQVGADHHKRAPARAAKSILGKSSPMQIADNAVRILRDRYLTPAATACYTRAALRSYAASLDMSSWGRDGPQIRPGQGIKPGVSKGQPLGPDLEGDIEVGVWRLLGSPNWPPARQA